MRSGRPQSSLTVLISAVIILLLMGGVSHAQSVQFMEKDGLHVSRYMVRGAEGANQQAAVDVARAAALRFAGEDLAGDANRGQAGAYLSSRPAVAMGFVNMKRIMKTSWGSKGPKLDVLVDVDTTQLRKHLETQGLAQAGGALAEQLDSPTIMVLTSELDGKQQTRTETQLGEVVTDYVTSFLTERRWSLVDRKAALAARKKLKAISGIQGMPQDVDAQVALSAGADIYMVFSVTLSTHRGMEASVSVKAKDVTTAQLMASATESSRQHMAGTPAVKVLQEALGNAMPKVFKDLQGYWQQQAAQGRPVKVVVRGDFSNRGRYKAVKGALKEVGKWKKAAKSQSELVGTLRFRPEPDEDDDLEDLLEEALEEEGISQFDFTLTTRSLYIIDLK